MKVYEGRRTMDGLEVTVDGAPLPERYDVKQFTPYGFEWTYEGAEPRQLSLALLADHLGDGQRALALSEAFMSRIVSNLDNDWTLTSDDIEAALGEIEGRKPTQTQAR